MPGWFLSSLLCYDLWHRLFIERSLPREQATASSPVPESAMSQAEGAPAARG
jgi:hypothetical protein